MNDIIKKWNLIEKMFCLEKQVSSLQSFKSHNFANKQAINPGYVFRGKKGTCTLYYSYLLLPLASPTIVPSEVANNLPLNLF